MGPLEGPRSVIRAHRYMLVSRSSVFEAMLYGRNRSALQTAPAAAADAAAGAAESNASSSPVSGEMPGEMVISITDTDPGIFRQLLK